MYKQIADQTSFTIANSPIWRIKVQEYSQAIVASCVEQISDLQGYSGVGVNGDPYDTQSWNAALKAAQDLLRIRFEINDEQRRG